MVNWNHKFGYPINVSNETAYESLLKRLKVARKKAGLNQSELAEILGVHQTNVSLIERGQRNLDLMEFMRWSQALELDPETLVEELASDMQQIRPRGRRVLLDR